MTKPVIVKRATKGTPLTYEELDANFENLDNATITLQAGTGGTDVVSDLNGKITLVAGTNVTLSGDNTAKTLTISSSGSGSGITDVVQDTSPQLGGNLDVNGKSIVSVSNGNISLVPDGSGNIQLTPATGHVTISATNFPTGAGTSGQTLVTDGAGQASWSSISPAVGFGVQNKLPKYDSSNYKLVGSNLETSVVGSTTILNVGSSTDNIKVGTTSSYVTYGNSGYQTLTGTTFNVNSSGALNLSADFSGDETTIQMTSGRIYLNSTLSTGGISTNRPVFSDVDAGVATIDRAGKYATYANNATVPFSDFSGMIIINRQDGGSGNVALWIVGSGGAVKLGDSIGNQSGTIAADGSINGYRWTNNTGGTITVSFCAIRTRAAG